jgi:glycosyltransferase involved in cell wall biosynthesis
VDIKYGKNMIKKMRTRVIVCIPAYNEENTIVDVVGKSVDYCDLVIVCDDGSTDSTGSVSENESVSVIRHKKNQGYGSALRSLFSEARKYDPEIIITLDGDGQHNPEEIPLLLECMNKNDVDLVIGNRFHGSNVNIPHLRKMGVKYITGMVQKMYPDIHDSQSGYRAYNRDAYTKISFNENGMGASIEILYSAWKNSLKIKEVSIHVQHGSKNSTLNTLKHGLQLMKSIWKIRTIKAH